MNKHQYWIECLESSFSEYGISASADQISAIAEDIEVAQDNMSMAFQTPENPLIGEVERLERELKNERAMVHCRECDGAGRIITYGPYHGSDTQCWHCRGKGKRGE